MRQLALASIVVLASPALAEQLRSAPAYYSETIFAIQMAEALALSCSTVEVDLFATQARVTDLNAQLAEDDFDTDRPFAQMIDPSPAIRDLQTAFLERYPLQDPSDEKVCAAARSEIAEGTIIGQLLVQDPA